MQAVLARRGAGFDCEIVAFPQHGLLLSNSEKLMREAMQAGAHYVGGLDPTSVDGAMEKSLDTMFQIALDYDKGVDIHLHETSPAGVAAVNYMVETVEKTPALKGKLTISHAFALATLNEQQVDEIATRMAAQQVTIASTVPIGTLHMPLKQLRDKGVFVMTGTDSVIDHWSPYGLGDMLEKANLYAQLYIRPNEQTLSRALGIATGDVLPLNDKGERVWPKAQDDASFVLVDASLFRRGGGAHFSAHRDVPQGESGLGHGRLTPRWGIATGDTPTIATHGQSTRRTAGSSTRVRSCAASPDGAR